MNESSAIVTASDGELLGAFLSDRDEEAFRQLVELHLGWVLGVAFRRTGRRQLAEEIAQSVFTDLARRAGRLGARGTLAGWLHRATVLESADVMRRERAHDRKMKAYSEQAHFEPPDPAIWRDAAPVIDDAISALPAADRELVLLRFFQGHGFREIGRLLGKSEDAAQKQCQRALSKLARRLARAGVTVPAQALAGAISEGLATQAPAGLATTISAGALSGASALGVNSTVFNLLNLMSTTNARLAIAVAVIAAIPLTLQWEQNRRLRRDLAGLRASVSANAGGEASQPSGNIGPDSSASRAAPRNASSDVTASPAAAQAIAALWEQALLEPDPIRRMQRISELLSGLTPETAPVVAGVFARLKQNGSSQETEFNLFLRSWGRVDGAAAVAFALEQSRKGLASAELGAALAGWASVAPDVARAWAEAQPDGPAKETALYGLLDGWSLVDFDAAAAYAASRPRSQARNEFRELLLQRSLAAGGISEAQRWFSSIPDDEHNQLYKQRALDEVIHAMLYRDPAAAAQWIQQLGDSRLLEGSAVTDVAGKLSQTAPLEALRWLDSLGGVKTGQRDAGLRTTMETWAGSDPNAAGTWLQQHANDAGYDTLAGTYAQTLAATDVKSAVAWAQSVHDDVTRPNSLAAVVTAVYKAFGADAANQLRTAGLPEGSLVESPGLAEGLLTRLRSVKLENEQLEYARQIELASRAIQDGIGASGSGGIDLVASERIQAKLDTARAELDAKREREQLDLGIAFGSVESGAGGQAASLGGSLSLESGKPPTSQVDSGSWQRFLAAHDLKSLNPDCRSCHRQ